MGRKCATAIAAALIAASAAVAVPSAAVAAPDPVAPAELLTPQRAREASRVAAVTGPWIIVNRRSGRCLDADTNTIGTNGTTVHLWDCRAGATNSSGAS